MLLIRFLLLCQSLDLHFTQALLTSPPQRNPYIASEQVHVFHPQMDCNDKHWHQDLLQRSLFREEALISRFPNVSGIPRDFHKRVSPQPTCTNQLSIDHNQSYKKYPSLLNDGMQTLWTWANHELPLRSKRFSTDGKFLSSFMLLCNLLSGMMHLTEGTLKWVKNG